MTTRRPRDLSAERSALRASADRLLEGTPLRSESGSLTVTELLRESGLRRDVVYGDHKDLVEEFQARARAQQHTPALAQSLADENAGLKERLAEATSALARERELTAALRRLVAELDLELHEARDGLGPSRVTALPARRRPEPRA
jgi:secreted protein with Ig-like and vWFA domain